MKKMIDQTMKEHCALRLYFPTSAKARRTRFWHRLGAPSLSHHLLTQARKAGIRQALAHHVSAGFLRGQRLAHLHVDGPARHHPQCLELVDSEARLRAFLETHAHDLQNVEAVLFRCELPIRVSELTSTT
jgi:PII-like signaling protein